MFAQNAGVMELEADIIRSTIVTSLEDVNPVPAGCLPGFYDKFDATPFPYSRISPKHQRCFASLEPVEAVDEYGHLYSSLQIKGTYFPHYPRRRENITSTNYQAYGLGDDLDLGAGPESAKLRAAGLPAEHIIYAGELQEGIVQGQRVSIATYRRELVEAERYVKLNPDVGFENWVLEANFYGMVRLTETGSRLSDFDARYTHEMNRGFLAEMVAHQNRNAMAFSEPAADIDAPKDVGRLVFEALPERIGQATALLHRTGKSHLNLHPGNWLISGMFVDLDTVCDDNPIGQGYEQQEVIRQMGRRLNHVGGILFGMGLVEAVPEQAVISERIRNGLALTSESLSPLL